MRKTVQILGLLALMGTHTYSSSQYLSHHVSPLFKSLSQRTFLFQNTEIKRSFHVVSTPQFCNSFFTSKRFAHSKKKHESIQIGHPCIDAIFQYGFSEPSILSSFLNAALELEEKKHIVDIQYLPKDMPSSNSLSELQYHFTVDVRCRTKDNQHFLVEMQNDFRDDYHLKTLVEHSRMTSRLDIEQHFEDQNQRLEKNKNDKKKFWKGIQGLYTIVLTNKTFPFERMKINHSTEPFMEPLLVNPYEFRHTKQLDRHYGDIPNRIVLLMLDNLKTTDGRGMTPIEKWASIFRDPALKSGVRKIPEIKELSDPNIIDGDDKAISSFIERIKLGNLPNEVRESYIRNLHYYNTTLIDIEDKAIKKGLIEGRIEGRMEEKIGLYLKKVLKGKTDDQIMDEMEITSNELNELKSAIHQNNNS